MRLFFALIGLICFVTNLAQAGEKAELKLDSVRVRVTGNATYVVVGVTNTSGSPVKAFRGVLTRTNDFNEAKKVCSVEFSSQSEYRTSGSRPVSHHVIKAGETIFYTLLAMDNGTTEAAFTAEPGNFQKADGTFAFLAEKVVHDVTP